MVGDVNCSRVVRGSHDVAGEGGEGGDGGGRDGACEVPRR